MFKKLAFKCTPFQKLTIIQLKQRLQSQKTTQIQNRRINSHITLVIKSSLKQLKYDVVGISNLCLDVVVPVNELPRSDCQSKKDLLSNLKEQPAPRKNWEVGGMCNFLIAASRLGLNALATSYVVDDIYSEFYEEILNKEHVEIQKVPKKLIKLENSEHPCISNTLICYVLVDPKHKHSFCSYYDVTPGPILQIHDKKLDPISNYILQSKSVFINGFVLDEWTIESAIEMIKFAIDSNKVTFFDPGPRIIKEMTKNEKLIHEMLKLSNVILMTEDEMQKILGTSEPKLAAHIMFSNTSQCQWMVIKRGKNGSLLIRREQEDEILYTPGFEVKVEDTVGCGDSFASAIVLGYLRDRLGDPRGIMSLANAIGAATAGCKGAGRNVADLKNILKLLNEHIGELDCTLALKLLNNSLKTNIEV